MEPRSFYTYHKNPSVWTRCLGKNTGKSINSKISQVLPMLRHHLGMFPFFPSSHFGRVDSQIPNTFSYFDVLNYIDDDECKF